MRKVSRPGHDGEKLTPSTVIGFSPTVMCRFVFSSLSTSDTMPVFEMSHVLVVLCKFRKRDIDGITVGLRAPPSSN